jgi:hypothetical protein
VSLVFYKFCGSFSSRFYKPANKSRPGNKLSE